METESVTNIRRKGGDLCCPTWIFKVPTFLLSLKTTCHPFLLRLSKYLSFVRCIYLNKKEHHVSADRCYSWFTWFVKIHDLNSYTPTSGLIFKPPSSPQPPPPPPPDQRIYRGLRRNGYMSPLSKDTKSRFSREFPQCPEGKEGDSCRHTWLFNILIYSYFDCVWRRHTVFPSSDPCDLRSGRKYSSQLCVITTKSCYTDCDLRS